MSKKPQVVFEDIEIENKNIASLWEKFEWHDFKSIKRRLEI